MGFVNLGINKMGFVNLGINKMGFVNLGISVLLIVFKCKFESPELTKWDLLIWGKVKLSIS